jgi:hypothetical protein
MRRYIRSHTSNKKHKGVPFRIQAEEEENNGARYWLAFAKCNGQRHSATCRVRFDTRQSDLGKFRSRNDAERDVVKRMKSHIDKEHRN